MLNNFAITFLTIFMVTNKLQLLRSSPVQVYEVDTFRNMRDRLFKVSNTIFKMLTMNRNFAETARGKLLLIMFLNMKDSIKNNLQKSKDVVIASRVDNSFNETIIFPNMTNELHKILFKKFLITLSRKRKRNEMKHYLNVSSVVVTNENEISLPLFDDMITSMEKMKIRDILKCYKFKEEVIRKKVGRLNLKPWSKNQSFGWRNDTRRLSTEGIKVFNEMHDNINVYSFMASFHYEDKLICTGSIVNMDFIITSASCLHKTFNAQGKDPVITISKNLTARVGSQYSYGDMQYIPIEDVIFHPYFDRKYLKHNLALAKMERRLINKHKKLRRIEYDKDLTRDMDITIAVTILGWDSKDQSGQAPTLSVAEVDVYQMTKCLKTFSEQYVNPDNFCIDSKNISTEACNTDTGGAAVYGDKLIGVISFGPPICGLRNRPIVLTKIGFYADWIDKTIDLAYQQKNSRRMLFSNEENLEETLDRKLKSKSLDDLNVSLSASEEIQKYTMIIKNTTEFDSSDVYEIHETNQKNITSNSTAYNSTISNSIFRPHDIIITHNTESKQTDTDDGISIEVPSQYKVIVKSLEEDEVFEKINSKNVFKHGKRVPHRFNKVFRHISGFKEI